MSQIEFKRSISLDTVVGVIVLLITLLSLAADSNRRFAALEVKVDAMWERYRAVGK